MGVAIGGDAIFLMPCLRVAEALARHRPLVWVYQRTYVPRLINTGRVLYLHQARQAGRIWYKPPYHETIGDERQHSDR
jgi:hypothetical protein